MEAFTAALPAGVEIGDDVETALDEVVARAQAELGTVDVDDFVAFVAKRLRPGADVIGELEKLHVEDLALAWACARGDEAAMGRVLARHDAAMRAAAIDCAGDGFTADEVVQSVRERLFGVGGPAKIADYAGRGPLAGWLRVAARRAAIDAARARDRRPDRPAADDEILEHEVAELDVEMHYMKDAYREAFDDALREGLATLSARERNLLRHRLVLDAQVQDLARMHGVDRRTIARWMTEARTKVFETVRRNLTAKLRLGADELDSLLHVVRSRLRVSLTGALRSEGA